MRNEYVQPIVRTILAHAADGASWSDPSMPDGAEFRSAN